MYPDPAPSVMVQSDPNQSGRGMQIGAGKRPRKRKRALQFNMGKHMTITFSKLAPTLLSNLAIPDGDLRDIPLADDMRFTILQGLTPKEMRDTVKHVYTDASPDLVDMRMRT